ncbi:MAG TPA: DMT family transporter [Microlunatus sp.]
MSIECMHPAVEAPTGAPTARARLGRTDPARLTGSVTAATSLFLIGSAAPVAATLEVPLLAGQGFRYIVATAALMIILAFAGRLSRAVPRPRDLGRIGLLGAFGVAGFTSAFVLATRYADPALVGSVLAATPVVLAVVGPLLRRQRPAIGVIIGALTVTAGTAIATGAGSSTPPGIGLCLIALGSEVAFTVFAMPLIDRYGTLSTTLYAAVSGAVLLSVAGMIIDGPTSMITAGTRTSDLPALLYLGLAVSVGANLAWYAALPRLGPDRAGLFYAFSPIGALSAGLVLGTSSPTAGEVVGLAVVLIGLLVGLRARTRDQRPTTVGRGASGQGPT